MKKVFFALTIVSLLVLSCGNALTGTGEAEVASRSIAAPVKVVSINDTESFHYGIPARYRTVRVKVANLAFEKELYIFAEMEDGSWSELNPSGTAQYVGPAEDGYEIFDISASWTVYYGATAWADELVIKYVVDGQTYWDNNGGANYSAEAHSGYQIFDTDVLVANTPWWSSYSNAFYGNINVRNLSYDKDVEIVYTFNNWETTFVASATYNRNYGISYASPISSPNQHGIENWSFNVQIPEGYGAEDVQFAVAYTPADGVTRWDNNYGNNYTVVSRY